MFTMRKAELSDLNDIYSLGEKYLEHESWTKDSIALDIVKEDRLYLVAVIDECAIGYISFSFVLDSADLLQVVVSHEHRNKGIATKLFICAKEILLDLGVRDIMLEVRQSNDSAKKLYQSLGFSCIAKRKNYYQNEDALIYKLEW